MNKVNSKGFQKIPFDTLLTKYDWKNLIHIKKLYYRNPFDIRLCIVHPGSVCESWFYERNMYPAHNYSDEFYLPIGVLTKLYNVFYGVEYVDETSET